VFMVCYRDLGRMTYVRLCVLIGCFCDTWSYVFRLRVCSELSQAQLCTVVDERSDVVDVCSSVRLLRGSC